MPMIVTQTPLRISFLGGGSDFPEFYGKEPGCVLSATIDKFVYVVLKGRYDRRIRIGYSRTELADDVDGVEHDLVREALRITGIAGGVEMSTMADIPSAGSGLGSSASVSVGLLHAMWLYQGDLPSREQLADGACRIELDRLARPIGKQDQYAVAYGGLNVITFDARGVSVEPAVHDPAIAARLGERLMLFFTGVTRNAADVLAEQRANIEDHRGTLRLMADQARQGRRALAEGNLDVIGELMNDGWAHKKRLASKITNAEIDALYDTARAAGAIGGKVSGAGGGGYLLLYCLPEHQEAVRAALHGVPELEFSLESDGTVVLMHHRRR